MFSANLEKCISELSDIHFVHPDSSAIPLLNFAAAALEFSFVLQANCVSNKLPTNLFDMTVSRSCKW